MASQHKPSDFVLVFICYTSNRSYKFNFCICIFKSIVITITKKNCIFKTNKNLTFLAVLSIKICPLVFSSFSFILRNKLIKAETKKNPI